MAEELTIARALSKIKILNSQMDFTWNIAAVTINGIVDSKISGNLTGEEFVKSVDSKLASNLAILKNVQKLKSAVAEANISNFIEFKGEKYTLLDAINLKASLNEVINIYTEMQSSLTIAMSAYKKKEDKQNEDIQRIIEQSFGNKNNQPKDVIETITNNFKSATKVDLVTLFTEEELLENMKGIKEDIKEIDFLLSEANATIKIKNPLV